MSSIINVDKITASELFEYFHMNFHDTAKTLQVSKVKLKKMCLKNNIGRWPYKRMEKWLNEGYDRDKILTILKEEAPSYKSPFTASDLYEYFHMPLRCVLDKLSIRKSKFRKICIDNDIVNWPYTRMSSWISQGLNKEDILEILRHEAKLYKNTRTRNFKKKTCIPKINITMPKEFLEDEIPVFDTHDMGQWVL